MKKMKLQTRFFLAYFFLALVIISAFSVIFYRYTSRILIEQETKAAISLNSGFLTQTEQIIDDMDSVSINISYSNLVKDSLYEDLDIATGSDEFRNLANLFVSINGADIKVDQINLYDFEGHVIQVGIKSKASSVNLEEYDWFDTVQALEGKKYISTPYQTTALSANLNTRLSPVWYISLYRSFNNKYKKEMGVIETVKKCNSVFKYIISYQKKNDNPAGVYIYNSEGTLMYPFSISSEEKDKIPDYYHAIDDSVSSRSYTNPISGLREIMAYESSSYTGWTYITVQPENIILAPVHNLVKLLLLVVFLMLVFSAFLSYQLSRSLSRPIKQLRSIIKKTALATLGQQPAPINMPYDELEELNQAFQKMSSDLKTSMDELIDTRQQELKSRSLALQSQINPHFYYNTLSSIIVLAENNQSDEVAVLCRNLTKIMRYITNSGTQTVKLKEEIEYVKEYLYCMKVRYQSSLDYEIDIDNSILEEPIPKLIIQPIVENALKYGTDCIPPWNITVTSQVTPDFWQIDITDSGNGFTEDRIALIDSRIKEAGERTGMPELQINGLGLLNVYLRWKLYCQDDIIFTYGNTEDGHGKVSIGRRKKITGE